MKTLGAMVAGVVLVIGGLYMAPMVNMWWQTQRATVEVSEVQKSYDAEVKNADSVMAQEVKQAHAERDAKIMGAQNNRDASMREIAAKYPKAKLPRQVAIVDRAQ
jgi:hypothetical protein